jgi:hypothetical protein
MRTYTAALAAFFLGDALATATSTDTKETLLVSIVPPLPVPLAQTLIVCAFGLAGTLCALAWAAWNRDTESPLIYLALTTGLVLTGTWTVVIAVGFIFQGNPDWSRPLTWALLTFVQVRSLTLQRALGGIDLTQFKRKVRRVRAELRLERMQESPGDEAAGGKRGGA